MIDEKFVIADANPGWLGWKLKGAAGGRERGLAGKNERIFVGAADVSDKVDDLAVVTFLDIGGILAVIGECIELGFHYRDEFGLANSVDAGVFDPEIGVDRGGGRCDVVAVDGFGELPEDFGGVHQFTSKGGRGSPTKGIGAGKPAPTLESCSNSGRSKQRPYENRSQLAFASFDFKGRG